jgi:U1 small nuclear ribonucleoprotein
VQIRIVTNPHADPVKQENQKKGSKKKTHQGYAFIVYEREKDMKGKYWRKYP